MTGVPLWSAHFLDPDSEELDRFDVQGVAEGMESLDIVSRIHYEKALRDLRDDATTMNPYVRETAENTFVILYRTVAVNYHLDYAMRRVTLLRVEHSPGP